MREEAIYNKKSPTNGVLLVVREAYICRYSSSCTLYSIHITYAVCHELPRKKIAVCLYVSSAHASSSDVRLLRRESNHASTEVAGFSPREKHGWLLASPVITLEPCLRMRHYGTTAWVAV